MADQLACKGAKKPAVDIDIGLELTEVYTALSMTTAEASGNTSGQKKSTDTIH